MQAVIPIEKIAAIQQVQMLVEYNSRDTFSGELRQVGTLPHIFYYGDKRTMLHSCANCAQQVGVEFAYGKQMIGFGALAKQDFNDNKVQLDIFGRLFGQYLFQEIDYNGFETYLYQSDPDNIKGALLNTSYYRCSHCQTQYLVLYQNQLKEDRPPFEPDEILIDQVLQVRFDEPALLKSLNRLPAIT
jgi:hypothetical protein